MTRAKPYTDETGEVRELDKDFITRAKRGRPALPEGDKKQRINIMLDPDVVKGLKAKGNMSARANALLRKSLGL